jgi:hypothetical protein
MRYFPIAYATVGQENGIRRRQMLTSGGDRV